MADITHIGQLNTDRRNRRKHTARNVGMIADALHEVGAARSIVIDELGTILAGNATIEAAAQAGIERVQVVPADGHTIVAVQRAGLTDEQKRRLALYDNRTAELAEWNADQIARDVAEKLSFEGLFSQGELSEILANVQIPDQGDPPEAQMERADELRDLWKTEVGQLWQLGEHRLICGDCTDRAVVERVMGGEKASLVFTDPPYGVSVAAKNRLLNSVLPSGRCLVDIVDDSLPPEALKASLLPAFVLVREVIMADDCTVFVTAPQGGALGMMMMMMREAGLPVRHVLIWKKNQPTFSLGRLDYDYQHEPILLTWGKRHKRPMRGPHRTSVWEIDRPRASAEHPTMKPVALVENALLNNSDPGDVVADPYVGSGTTLLACEAQGRKCCAIEIEPKYVAVTLQRWADYTHQSPVLVE